MEYVTGWRMQHAYDALVVNNKSVTQIAEDCGYQSEAAFRKAFKKNSASVQVLCAGNLKNLQRN
jgi:transcriptional regulator GlxA family with amidase domain